MYNKLRVKYSSSSSPLYESMFFQAGKAQKPQELNWSSLGCQSDPEMSRFRKSNPSVAEIFAAPL